jgi:hypothetical protein
MLTEFGGISLCEGRGTWGYSEVADARSLADAYRGLVETVIHTPLFSGFCYTQFCDTFQEANGLLYADRTPKVPLDEIRRVNTISRTYIPGGV